MGWVGLARRRRGRPSRSAAAWAGWALSVWRAPSAGPLLRHPFRRHPPCASLAARVCVCVLVLASVCVGACARVRVWLYACACRVAASASPSALGSQPCQRTDSVRSRRRPSLSTLADFAIRRHLSSHRSPLYTRLHSTLVLPFTILLDPRSPHNISQTYISSLTHTCH